MSNMNDWPKTIRVSGREYEVHPEMSVSEFVEVADSFQNEAEKFTTVAEAIGIDLDLDDEL